MSLSLVADISEVPLVFVDVETTGSDPMRGDRVTEIGLFRLEPSGEVTEYQRLLDPCRPVPASITALTGISDEMVRGQPTFSAALPEWRHLACGALLIGHNVRFDLQFLFAECFRSGTGLGEVASGVHVVDTLQLARKRLGQGGNALQVLAERLGVPRTAAHRALADCLTTFGVLGALLAALRAGRANAALTVADLLSEQGGLIPLVNPAWEARAVGMALGEAAERGSLVRLDYVDGRTAAGGRSTTRIVRPVALRRSGAGRSTVVLVAHCQMRQELRAFRVDRIRSFQVLPPGPDQPHPPEVSDPPEGD